MKRNAAVALVAVFAAVASLGALGYAVLWGFDVTAPAPLASVTKQAAPSNTVARRRKPPVTVSALPHGEDAGSMPSAPGVCAGSSSDAARALSPFAPPDTVSALEPAPAPRFPRTPNQDAARARSAARRWIEQSPAAGTPSIAPPLASALIAEDPRAELTVPPDPEVTATVALPGSEGSRGPVRAPPRAALLPPRISPPRISPARIAVPRVSPLPPQTQRVVRSDPPLDAPGIVVVRGVPPVPGNSPGIVRPGPLIIEVPQPARRR